ncbi:sugar transferase [Leisingera sp. M658]|uniref:sugar transferase n=1 Tax=Leisingera sp. M658 TaxID=2867015 RepID=UPI0021A48146|nr:sugar transferase [Leisingera sp. M658]UWQ77557.1 sugar transferase [Leisingera sp. M658]
MFDFEVPERDLPYNSVRPPPRSTLSGFVFAGVKRMFDLVVSCAILLPLALMCASGLLLLNPFWNRGPLLYSQRRMGRGCRPFTAYKFRTMRPAPEIRRTADCPLEEERITPLGRFLRRVRLDELPQIINVFRGEMSLIGPRPDYIGHARRFLSDVPGYQERHAVRPGISGWAQVELGYIEGVDATRNKVRADLHYIANAGFAMEARIVWRTLSVIARRGGA